MVNTYKNQDVNTEATDISFFLTSSDYFKTKEDTNNMEKIQRLFIKKIKSLENNTRTKVKGTEIVQPEKVCRYNLISIQVYMKGSSTEKSDQLFSIFSEGRIKGNRQIEAQGF